jgi:plasmid stabilization system protein ParE
MRYSVSLTVNAKCNVRGIIRFIERSSRSGAETRYRRWLQVLDLLETSAEGCGLAPEDADHEPRIQQIIFKTRRGLPYRAVFVIRDERVYVLHVRGSGQDLISPDDLYLPPE